MQFIDEAKIFLKSGDGGNGCTAFRREAHTPKGGPNGGDGGRGGHIILRAIEGLNTLIDFRYKQHFKANQGEHGKGSDRHGGNGEDIIIHVPIGTQIFLEDGKTLLYDIMDPAFEKVIMKGGDGGFGNAHFKTSTNRAPRRKTPGWPGEEIWVWLKLKLLSDVGLVGLPNAGKSTFLARSSRAKPKIADYPFTTIKPQLGVVYVDNKEFVVSDLPGLIKGASEGHGLGHRFLKHVERCGVLLHLIDGSQESYLENYETIREELEQYNPELSLKDEIIGLNKIDMLSEEDVAEKKAALEKLSGKKVFTLSGVSGTGVTEILRALLQKVEARRAEEEQHKPQVLEVKIEKPEEEEYELTEEEIFGTNSGSKK
jgi:GTP-binding protein